MYGGHIGVALAAKGLRPRVPLALLVVATMLPDLADVAVCGIGIETTERGMLSHSFPAIAALAGVTALAAFAILRDRSAALLAGLVTVSHVVADYVTGLKPTWPGGPLIGLELYERPMADFSIEAAVMTAGWLLYRRTVPLGRQNSAAVLMLLAILLLLQAGLDVSFSLFPGLGKC